MRSSQGRPVRPTHAKAWRFPSVALGATLAISLLSSSALARTGIRPLFEPTDLQLEDPGIVDFDFQLGLIRGRDPWRVVVPDFELNFGFLRNVELDLDGSYALEGNNSSPFTQSHAVPDALWPSIKVGLFDWFDDELARAWALGFQVGPKLPVARGSSGIGVEGLALLGLLFHGSHFVLNTGMLADPHPSPGEARPFGVELGLLVGPTPTLDDRRPELFAVQLSRFIRSSTSRLAKRQRSLWDLARRNAQTPLARHRKEIV